MSISKLGHSRCSLSRRSQVRLSYVVGLGLASLVGGCGTNGDNLSNGRTAVAGPSGGATNSTTPAIQSGGAQSSTGGGANFGGNSSGNSSPAGGNSAVSSNTGGVATGGATEGSAGGAVHAGGSASSTGGAPSTGGTRFSSSSTGGNPSVGGSSTVGATAHSGGSATSGGSAAKGGAATGGRSTGGASATGGSKATTGGAAASGGSTSTSSCTPSSTKFSFFVTSQARLFALAQAFNGSTKGFGGDLRYGQTTGLAGADKICTAIAEASMPGNCKTWRAFLSAADGGNGSQVNAISRIGNGPWYDRLGRLFGNSPTTIVATRPDGAAAIINDLPNEDGVLNHDALQTGSTTNQDNHDMLTGSTNAGTLYGANAHCTNWTSSAADNTKKPRVGHSWPAGSGQSWISVLDESGCGPGVNLVEQGGPKSDGTVGSGGGYGGFYCFALSP